MKLLLMLVLVMTSQVAMTPGQTEVPKAIDSPDPIYPAEAAEMGLGGTVVVFVELDKKGEVSVKQAFGPVAPCSNLDDKRIARIREAVVQAAKKARFEPFLSGGKPANIEFSLTFRFDKYGRPTRGPVGRVIDAGVLQGRIKHLARPDYPAGARANRAGGQVPVSVLTDTSGKVVAAAAMGGHPQLRAAASAAACRSAIEPVVLNGVPIEVTGVMTYSFVPS